MSTDAPRSRPVVKRQYGSRKTAPTSSSPRASSSSTPASISSTSSSISRFRSSLPSSEWSDTTSDADSSLDWSSKPIASSSRGGQSFDAEGDLATPPTSPDTNKGKQKELEPVLERRASPRKHLRSAPPPVKKNAVANAGDLRSFFTKVSPRKRPRVESDENDDTYGSSSSKSRSSDSKTVLPGRRKPSIAKTTTTSRDASSLTKETKPKLEQLYLDPFETSGHATLSCAVCSLSYARTPDDMELHAKHHKKVVGGCEWVTNDTGVKGLTVVDEAIEWGQNSGGRILMVDANVGGATGRKIKDVLETIDTELSSTSLTPSHFETSKLFLFVTSSRKVIACAVVERIESAYVVVPTTSEASSPSSPLLRFGEQDGAIFCSPTPSPTLLGVHRIWTSSSHRRHRLASLLLDASASRFIYGCPISKSRRREDVAFSQPTGKGQQLAKAWTGTSEFKVFID